MKQNNKPSTPEEGEFEQKQVNKDNRKLEHKVRSKPLLVPLTIQKLSDKSTKEKPQSPQLREKRRSFYSTKDKSEAEVKLDDWRRKVNSSGILVVKEPLKELSKLRYEIYLEKPPYSIGHQRVETFTKVFIHNLPFTVESEGLLRTFDLFGKIKEFNIPLDYRKRPRGLAFIIYEKHDDAKKAYD